jgi:hypothetical protein
MCPILSSGEFAEAKSGMKERDTIPKPVGLGMTMGTASFEQQPDKLRTAFDGVRGLSDIVPTEP